MLKTYKGGKGSSGTYQTIINYIPPCNLIVSPFFGNGYVERTIKCPENGIVGCELNDQMQIHFEEFKSTGQDSINIEAGCGIKLLEEIRECYKETDFIECYVRFGNILKRFGKRSMDRFTTTVNMKKLYIYIDPPYPRLSRKNGKRLYKHELSDQDHERILKSIVDIPCMVGIQSYRNDMYDDYLKDWNRIEYQTMTRAGLATEVFYMNYPDPEELHDYRFLGEDYRERERIKKKVKRWVNGLSRLPAKERNAIINAINQ